MFILLIVGYGWPTDGQTKWAAQRHATPEKLRIITTKSWIANSFSFGKLEGFIDVDCNCRTRAT
jgi:hypothetical protein